MGRNSRRRKRAALREQHDRRHTGARPHDDPSSADASSGDPSNRDTSSGEPPPYDESQVRAQLLQYARWARASDESRRMIDRRLYELAEVMAAPAHWEVVGAAVDHWLHASVGDALRRGWEPADLAHAVRQLVSPRAVRLVQLAVGSAGTAGDREGGSHWPGDFAQWCGAAALDRRPALSLAVRVIGLVGELGLLPSASPRASGHGVDAGILAKVRALLAKAEATDFPAEAEAFTAKAQQLMSRHSIDAAMLAAAGRTSPGGPGPGGPAGTAVRRVHLDDPYASQKAELLHVVAEANDARSVVHQGVRIATLVGYPTDLDLVELLFTSLLLQANQAMADAGRANADDRSASFRRSFLVAFAVRIRERLAEARRRAQAEGKRTYGAALVPALQARSDAVEAAFVELFPSTRRVGSSRSFDRRGWLAGRTAADGADMGGAHQRLAG